MIVCIAIFNSSSNSLVINPIEGVKECESVECFMNLLVCSLHIDGEIKLNKLSDMAGANTDPPPPVSIPKSLISCQNIDCSAARLTGHRLTRNWIFNIDINGSTTQAISIFCV